jgi:hypothetical protein
MRLDQSAPTTALPGAIRVVRLNAAAAIFFVECRICDYRFSVIPSVGTVQKSCTVIQSSYCLT